MIRLGVVSFLNARPLIEGLRDRADVRITFDVPSRLSQRLAAGEFDAALIPIVDVLASQPPLRVVSDACIGCDGETMTVRVFSQVPPDRIERMHADTDSHTSVMLARVIWHELFGRELRIIPLPKDISCDALDTILLIGDKVINPGRGSFAYEIDLGGAWRQHTGLPFIFAVWAMRCETTCDSAVPSSLDIAQLLSAARDRGAARCAEIARTDGPALGWPVELAERYLCRRLLFRCNDAAMNGAERFIDACHRLHLLPHEAAIPWPGDEHTATFPAASAR